MTRVEQYEIIRREHHVHGKGIRLVAREQGVHRRTVRQALSSAMPPPKKPPKREPPVLTSSLRSVIDGWLRADREAPRKQRHTARRIFKRLLREHGYGGAESTVRVYVGRRRRELGLPKRAYIPRDHVAGDEAEVDWYEADVEFPWGRERVFFLLVRACFSGREFHIAFPRATQQAFLQGQAEALSYFGGVFKCLRYDNLSSAVKRVLRGRRRVETDKFVAFRSHYLFEAEFCRPGKEGGPEKGGVESGVGRFRRNHLVPVPRVESYAGLNRLLGDWCAEDDQRRIEGRPHTVLEDWAQERQELRPLPTESFPSAEVSSHDVDSKSRVKVRTNRYSVPVGLVGRRVEVRVGAHRIEVVHGGRLVAQHVRCYGRHQEQLTLDHYIELLKEKPGALRRARPLRQARQRGEWPEQYDRLWAELIRRYGDSDGTREMLDVVLLHRSARTEDVHTAVARALEYGCNDAGAVSVVLRQLQSCQQIVAPLAELGPLARYERPVLDDLSRYDRLLAVGAPA